MSETDSLNILIVDDNKNNLFTLHTLINEHINAEIFEANSGVMALQVLLQERIDLIILDVQMPEMDGFETAQLIRSRKKTQHIPIVFLTAAYKSEEFKQKGFAVGAADYLTKPIDAPQLISRIRSYLRFIQQERHHNRELEQKVHERTAELLESNKLLEQEIIERKEIEEKLQKAHDELEQRVEERTAELSQTNHRLQAEINERTQAETALERLSRQTQLILESAGEGIFGLNLEGQTTFVNPTAARMLGYTPEELVGHYQHDIIHHKKSDGSFYAHEDCPIYVALRTGNTCHRDDDIFWRKDSSFFPVEYMITPIVEQGKVTGAVVTFSDITERKRAEAALQEAKEEAEKAQAAAEAANLAKSQFLANMSHELRTPLNAIIGYSEMLQEEAEESDLDDFIPDLQNIRSAGKHLLGLINDVLDISKIEAGKMELFLETFELSIIIQDIVATVQPIMEKKNNILQVNCQETLGTMYADLTKLRQVLFNLLSNAAKFTENGTIHLEVKHHIQTDQVILQVIDEGIGMTSEQQEKLFQPFTQADTSTTRKYGGTGLGLAITKEFIEMMGGNIMTESEFGQGTTFTVQLPLQVMTPAEKQALATSKADHGYIVVIEQEATTSKLFQDYLSQLGYAVHVAEQGQAGLQLVNQLRPEAVFLDAQISDIDGWHLLSTLKSNSVLADIPVFIIAEKGHQDMAYALGATDYLVRPINQHQIATALNRYHIGEHDKNLVMVVEDDMVSRELMSEMLKKEGWRVFKAENGRVALEHLDDKKPSLILLDLTMPEMDGFEFVVHLRKEQRWQTIPVVILTSTELTAEEQDRLRGYVDIIFQKETYNREELLVHIHKQITPASILQAQI
ncbi:MAG: response regulator [Pseudomonadota bacterium]|nr:response regulator [Pseudomonadota bacterium]